MKRLREFWEKESVKKIHKVLSVIVFFLAPVMIFYLMEGYSHNAFVEVRVKAQYFNILIFELLALIFFFLTASAKIALRIELILALVFGLTDHFVYQFRSTPFVPWDLYSVRTAASVASNYDFYFSRRMIVITMIFLAGFILAGLVDFRYTKLELKEGVKSFIRSFLKRLIPFVLSLSLLSAFVLQLWDEDFQTNNYLYPFLFTPTYMTSVNGMAVTFAMDLAFVKVDKPDGYKADKAKETIASYDRGGDELNSSDDDNPNIIVVMDEAFSDLAVLGQVDSNKDYMPFVHTLLNGADNTVSGSLNVSVCGGNTANTEYEFLTGNSMAFLPAGSIPYQQYIKSSKETIASHLKNLGYTTYGMHPYKASGWCRDTVYPMLGLDNDYFSDDFIEPEYVRCYISDQSDFDKIISLYENKGDSPMFMFNVTMQNHGGYTSEFEDLSKEITVESAGNSALEQYLNLIYTTDQALEKMVDYFRNQDEKTVICFFGDHQPNDTVASSVMTGSTTEEDRYKVPFVIWANYDIEDETNVDISTNYLAAYMLKVAGVKTSAYENYLLDLRESYPVISTVRVEGADDLDELYNEYNCLQYYQMFDNKEE